MEECEGEWGSGWSVRESGGVDGGVRVRVGKVGEWEEKCKKV